MSNQYQKTIPQQLTAEDKKFVKLLGEGMKKAPAFRESYPNNYQVQIWNRAEAGSPARRKAGELIATYARDKVNAQYMKSAIVSYTDSMERFSELSLIAATELVQNARSEKVRADLAIEGIRHKIGSPVTKVAVKKDERVVITFGTPPEETSPIEGEVVE